MTYGVDMDADPVALGAGVMVKEKETMEARACSRRRRARFATLPTTNISSLSLGQTPCPHLARPTRLGPSLHPRPHLPTRGRRQSRHHTASPRPIRRASSRLDLCLQRPIAGDPLRHRQRRNRREQQQSPQTRRPLNRPSLHPPRPRSARARRLPRKPILLPLVHLRHLILLPHPPFSTTNLPPLPPTSASA
jgi:hypothetical protein